MTDTELIQSTRERIAAAKEAGKTWREITALFPGLTANATKRVLTGDYSDEHSVASIADSLRTGKSSFDRNYEKTIGVRISRKQKIAGLAAARNSYAAIGTRKVKLRLNTHAKQNVVAKALRLALEIEDKNLTAKKYHGGNIAGYTYDQINYFGKQEGITELIEICKSEGWKFGVQRSDVRGATHVIYFHLPGVQQISWHFTPNDEGLPAYDGIWDQQENSTLKKLEPAIETLVSDASITTLAEARKASVKVRRLPEDRGPVSAPVQ